MNTMQGITMRRYHRMAQMEPAVRKAVEKMGYDDTDYHLRNVAHGRKSYSLRSAIILFKNGKPVGWVAMYMDEFVQHRGCSVWVNKSHRGNGYGELLMREAYDRWRRSRPEVHGIQYRKWREWDDARYAASFKTYQISPNASVTLYKR